MSNDIQSTFKSFTTTLTENTDAIYNDGTFPIDEVRTLEQQLHSIKRDLRLRELAFIPFFIPQITGITFHYFAGYEGDFLGIGTGVSMGLSEKTSLLDIQDHLYLPD